MNPRVLEAHGEGILDPLVSIASGASYLPSCASVSSSANWGDTGPPPQPCAVTVKGENAWEAPGGISSTESVASGGQDDTNMIILVHGHGSSERPLGSKPSHHLFSNATSLPRGEVRLLAGREAIQRCHWAGPASPLPFSASFFLGLCAL